MLILCNRYSNEFLMLFLSPIDPGKDNGEEDIGDECDPQIANSTLQDITTNSNIKYGPHLKLSRGDEIYKVQTEFEMVKERKVICSTQLLLQLFHGRCQTPGCMQIPVVTHHFIGTTIVVHSKCSSGHTSRFCSSHELTNGMYANNLQAAASVLLSGNNYAKIERLADFYGLAFISKSTYYRLQRLYLIPEISNWWSWMQEQIICEIGEIKVIVVGDGQCDSPGFNAKNLCYFFVDDETKYIINIEILDKRHVGLSSTNMEKEAVRRGLENLRVKNVQVVEFVTDASTSVKALLR